METDRVDKFMKRFREIWLAKIVGQYFLADAYNARTLANPRSPNRFQGLSILFVPVALLHASYQRHFMIGGLNYGLVTVEFPSGLHNSLDSDKLEQ